MDYRTVALIPGVCDISSQKYFFTAFGDLKAALQNGPVLKPPYFSSEVGLDVVFTQEQANGEHVVAYAFNLLHGAERRYSEKECLAIVWAVEKW